MSNTQQEYNAGYNAGLDALEAVSKTTEHQMVALTGILAAAMHATYAMAPNEEAAEELIANARSIALNSWLREQDWLKEQGKD